MFDLFIKNPLNSVAILFIVFIIGYSGYSLISLAKTSNENARMVVSLQNKVGDLETELDAKNEELRIEKEAKAIALTTVAELQTKTTAHEQANKAIQAAAIVEKTKAQTKLMAAKKAAEDAIAKATANDKPCLILDQQLSTAPLNALPDVVKYSDAKKYEAATVIHPILQQFCQMQEAETKDFGISHPPCNNQSDLLLKLSTATEGATQ